MSYGFCYVGIWWSQYENFAPCLSRQWQYTEGFKKVCWLELHRKIFLLRQLSSNLFLPHWAREGSFTPSPLPVVIKLQDFIMKRHSYSRFELRVKSQWKDTVLSLVGIQWSTNPCMHPILSWQGAESLEYRGGNACLHQGFFRLRRVFKVRHYHQCFQNLAY